MKEEEMKEDIGDFLKDREEIKQIVGKIGGKPNTNVKIVNTIFFVLLILSFVLPMVIETIPHIYILDFGVLLISIKIIYSLSKQAKVNHYQFWFLATLEWRLHELDSDLNSLREDLEDNVIEEDGEDDTESE